VPLVVVPLFADQFENARRIAATGAGVVVEYAAGAPIDARAASRVASAIEAVLADRSYRRRARSISAEMATAPTTEAVLAALTSELR
jgi:UDP:flavonoid glycosyltransferase YjiC (YdhE family)